MYQCFSLLLKKNKPVGEPIRVWIRAVVLHEEATLWLFALRIFLGSDSLPNSESEYKFFATV
jgi:hypothetical protein